MAFKLCFAQVGIRKFSDLRNIADGRLSGFLRKYPIFFEFYNRALGRAPLTSTPPRIPRVSAILRREFKRRSRNYPIFRILQNEV